MRLTGGSGPYQGSVEVLYNGVWVPLCSDSFDRFAATIVCQQLGYERGPLSVDNGLYPGVGWTGNSRMYLNGTCQSETTTLLSSAWWIVESWEQCCGCDAAAVTCDNRTGGHAAWTRGLCVGPAWPLPVSLPAAAVALSCAVGALQACPRFPCPWWVATSPPTGN